jgi:hypothetical protein
MGMAAASVRFHRPDSGLGLGGKAQATLKSIRMLEEKIRLWDLTPGNELLSERNDNEAYLACQPGRSYVVLFTNGGDVGLNLIGQDEDFELQWLEIGRARWSGKQKAAGGGTIQLDAPGSGLWLAVLTR